MRAPVAGHVMHPQGASSDHPTVGHHGGRNSPTSVERNRYPNWNNTNVRRCQDPAGGGIRSVCRGVWLSTRRLGRTLRRWRGSPRGPPWKPGRPPKLRTEYTEGQGRMPDPGGDRFDGPHRPAEQVPMVRHPSPYPFPQRPKPICRRSPSTRVTARLWVSRDDVRIPHGDRFRCPHKQHDRATQPSNTTINSV